MRNNFAKRIVIAFSLIVAPFASAHIKWVDFKNYSTQDVEIIYSESLVPFMPERAFTAGDIKIRDGENFYEINKMVKSVENTNSFTKISIKFNGNVSALYLHPAKTIKPAKIDKGTGRYLPPRIEISRLSVFSKNISVGKDIPPHPNYLDAVPGYASSDTKTGKKYTIRVFRDGKIIKPSNFFIYNSVKNSFIIDYEVLANGQVEFVPDAGNKYLFQADELIFTPGASGVKGVAHTHVFASLIFST